MIMSYSVECVMCKKLFTKVSNASTEMKCGDCVYKSFWSKSKNLNAAIGNDELSKRQILKKMNGIDERLKSFDEGGLKEIVSTHVAKEIKTQSKSFESTIKELAKKAGMSYSKQFKELKKELEASQKEHEVRMKTLLATVNSNFIATQKKVDDRLELLGKRVTELRRLAKQNEWLITPAKDANGTTIKD